MNKVDAPPCAIAVIQPAKMRVQYCVRDVVQDEVDGFWSPHRQFANDVRMHPDAAGVRHNTTLIQDRIRKRADYLNLDATDRPERGDHPVFYITTTPLRRSARIRHPAITSAGSPAVAPSYGTTKLLFARL
jgi:hypothetical protein